MRFLQQSRQIIAGQTALHSHSPEPTGAEWPWRPRLPCLVLPSSLTSSPPGSFQCNPPPSALTLSGRGAARASVCAPAPGQLQPDSLLSPSFLTSPAVSSRLASSSSEEGSPSVREREREWLKAIGESGRDESPSRDARVYIAPCLVCSVGSARVSARQRIVRVLHLHCANVCKCKQLVDVAHCAVHYLQYVCDAAR